MGRSSLCNLFLRINPSAPAEWTLSRKKRLSYQPVAIILAFGRLWRICWTTSTPDVSGKSISIKICVGCSSAARFKASSPLSAIKILGFVNTLSNQSRKRERRIGDGSTSKNTGPACIAPVFSFSVLNLSVGKS